MTEALTAEERAMVCGGDTDHAAKLLRLYDAALARAEAAEEQAHIEEVLRCGAESRLAEARAERDTALARVPLAQKCDNYRTALPAWNDEITARIKAQGERDTALARIAELTEHNVQQGVRYEFRIARAVAELEASGILTHEDPDPTHVARALEALR